MTELLLLSIWRSAVCWVLRGTTLPLEDRWRALATSAINLPSVGLAWAAEDTCCRYLSAAGASPGDHELTPWLPSRIWWVHVHGRGAVCLPQGNPGTKASSLGQGNRCPFVPCVPVTHCNFTRSQSCLRGFPELPSLAVLPHCQNKPLLVTSTPPVPVSKSLWRIRTITWIALDIGLMDRSQNGSPPHLPSSLVCEEYGYLPQDQRFYGSHFGFSYAIVAVHNFLSRQSHMSRYFLS